MTGHRTALLLVAAAALAVGVVAALYVTLPRPAQPAVPVWHTTWCKRTDQAGYPPESVLSGGDQGAPAQACARMDTWPGERWVPTAP
jgi:hypothetical protein